LQSPAPVPSAHPGAHPAEDFSCDLRLERDRENGRLLLFNGPAAPSRPLSGAQELLIWAPAGAAEAAAVYPDPDAERRPASGVLASLLPFLAELGGPLGGMRLLESEAAAACCGSRLVVELAGSALVFRVVLHRPSAAPAPQLLELRPAYPRRQASEWAVCEWNSRWLDPVEASGVLFADERIAPSGGPAAYVLWRDVDGAPRAWEAFAAPLLPELVAQALGGQFRYVDRDHDLLVVDRSPAQPAAGRRPLVDELVQTEAFATPPLPDQPGS
jgi:hypothetical protein